MENSEGKSGGAEISKKTKSLDIQSLYQSRVPKEGHNKGKNSVGDDEVRKKKRKSRKRVALSSLEQASKKSRSSLDQVCVNGASAGSGDSDRLLSGLGLKLTSSGGLNGISLNLDGDGNVIRIPKGKRGSVRRKKFENKHVSKPSGSSSSVDQIAKLNDEHRKLEDNQVSKTAEPSDSKATSIDQIVKLNSKSKSAGKVVSPKVKQKCKVDDDSKAKRTHKVSSATHKVSSARHARKEGGPLDVSNGDASSRKRRRSHSKRKDLASGSETVAKKVEPSVDNSASICHDFQDDDEENLEQNAARMLSSRFDPSCTGFSQKTRSSESPSANGLSFLSPSDREFGGRGVNSLACPDSAYADTASRILRPRKRHRDKDLSRKRRHFYEILSNDVDAYWCLNRRIKVFWPLDESWYYGLVSDYDPERKLHHIKYDDRDEEWINLQSERFKLLMLASEVPDTVEPKESAMGDKHTDTERRDLIMNDDTYVESHMDSEPIISWLARSSRRVKSSPSGALKKQKISHPSLNFVPPLLCDKTKDACGGGEVGLLERETSISYALPDTLTDVGRSEKSVSKSTTSSKESKFPVVYVRRRFRKKHESKSVTTLSPVVDSFHTSKECNISVGCLDPDELLWPMNSACMLKLTMAMVRCKKFTVELQLPLCPLLEYQFGAEIFWLFRTVLLLQYGTIVTTWPKVQLEVLFVDNIVGLRFFLFEGCLKQVVAFVFLVLTVFLEPNKQGKYVDLQMPVTSIRFKLSSIQDLRKQHVFAYYSFSKLKNSKWLYLDCKLQRHCLLTRQLPLPECTYDNIKALEGGSKQLHTSSVGRDQSIEGLQANSVQGIMPMGVFKEPFRVNWNSVVKHGILPPFALSFTAAPTFFLSLHLKLLMERSIACVSLQDHDTVYTLEHSGKTCQSITDRFTHVECCSENAPENTPESNLGTPLTEGSGWPSSAKPHPGTDAVSVIIDGDCVKSSQHMQNGKVNVTETSSCSKDPGNTAVDVIVQSKKWEHNDQESEQFVTSPLPLVSKNHASPVMSSAGCCSVLDGMSVEIPPCEQVERNGDAKTQRAQQASDLAWNVSDDIVCSPSPTGPRILWHRSRNGSSSSPRGDSSHVWSDGKTNLLRSGFGNGPKKPRTQVQYALPFGGFDVSSKHKIHNQNGHPYRRIRRANEKRTSDGSRSSQRNLELLACDANVLITDRDKGWRECGARVVLELADQNEWKLAVKVAGSTKYSYKVRHAWQAGSSNRYTHAMMWKVANDWILEFPDRSQWMLFKEMHEECHNRNIRAALVKNIPIPGVRLIEESDDNTTEMPFVHSSPKYFRQVETDVDMAMDPSHILYDMDSEDEKWILQNQKSLQAQESICKEFTEELFEKTMDMFEKVAYAQQRDHFTADEMEELVVGVGSMEVIKAIYEHWRQKRQRKGMPLIRQLQAPLWTMYQQQVKEWEQSVTKGNTAPSNGCQDKVPSNEKPPMFAFCLKPRGLEALNKGSKHRPQRRFHVSGHSHAVLGDQDGLHAFGRRLNGFALGDERVLCAGNSHDSSDASPLLQVSTRVYSPKDGPGYFSLSSDASEWNHNPKLHRNKSKKIGTFLPPGNSQTVASYNQRTVGKRNAVHRWNMALPEWPSQKHHQPEGSHRHGIEQFGGSDLNEFRLRDASGAAQHALNMAKLKREKAQRLLYRADLAIHKAVVSLMTADAIKASTEESNGDGVDQIK